jgi:DNA-binding NtrC family response regulator
MSGRSEITADSILSLLETKQETSDSIFIRPMPLIKAKDELERAYVQTQLAQNNWDIPKTAEILGLHRTNLHRKIRQLGIEKIVLAHLKR